MPNNYWDDLFQSDNTSRSDGGSVFDDLFSDDFGVQGVPGGLQMDEWNPEYQKQEGWGDLGEYLSGGNPIKDRGLEWSDTRNLIGPAGQLLFGNDNPINRFTGKVVSGVGDIVLSTAKSGADLFSYATEKVNSGLTSAAENNGLLAPDVADKMRESFAGDRKEFNDLVKQPLGDAADLMGDITSNLSAKKDFGGGYMTEMGGNLDTLLESGSVKDAVSALWETAEDTGGMAMDVGAGMLSSAIAGGPVGEISGLGSVGAGMALQAYSDTYDELTKNDGDSRALAVTVSAANAAVQGILEKIGWETALGKGPVAEWFEVNAKDTVLKSMLARSILTAPTEGSEEFMQEFTDIIAKNLPNVKRDGWEATFTKIKEQAYNQMPEAAFTGFAFGGLLGGAVAPMQNLAAKDIAARYGNLNVDPDRKLADSINQPTSDEKAKDALIDVVEQEGGLAGNGDLTGTFPVAVVDSNGNMAQNNIPDVGAKQENVKRAAKNAKASKKAVDNAIKDLALEQEKQRAELSADKTTADIDAAAERITRSIDTVVQEKQTQVDTLMGEVSRMTQLLQGTQPTFNTGAEGEQEIVQAPQIQASPEEVSGVILAKAQELGLEVPIEAAQNPIGFDWNTWGQQQVTQAKESVVEGLKGPVDAIRSSISVEPDSPMASVLASIPEPTVELPEPIYEDESMSSRILRLNQIKNKEAPVVPNTDNMADATAWNSDFGGLRRIAMSAKEGTALLPSEQNITDHKAVLDRILRIAPNMQGNETVAHLAGVYAGYMREVLYAPGGNTRKATAAARVALAINREIRKQNIPGVNIMPTLVGAVPNIEATNRYTRNLQYGPERNNPQVFSGGASLGSWLIGASESVARGLGFDQEKVDRVTNNAKVMADQAAAAFAVAPQIKSIIFNVWQTAPKALVDRLGDAMRNGHDANPNELATMVADHLASQGLYVDMPQLIESNPDAMVKFSSALVGVGKGIMSPWSMERIMLATGTEVRAAKAGVAALQSMAERWAMKNNGTVFEWWDRFGDYARVMEFADRTVLGTASADRFAKDRPLYGIQNALEYGKGMLRLFKSGEPLSVKTALHESIHMLYSSGLMGEMLDDEAKTAMEQLCGEKLWGANGQPLKISNLANEKMAVGFEKFMFENDAPNNRLRAAFEDTKQFFKNFVKYMFKDYKGPWNSHPDYNTIPIYGLKNADVYLEMGDLDINGPQIRAYYQLLNANPDGTEIAYSAPGIATAVENLITATTGIEAKGVLTYQPEPALPPYQATIPEDDWSIHELNGPSDSQWRRMIGLTNDESNGTHTHATLLEMAKNRERVTDLAKRTSAQNGMVPPAPLESRASVNREVLSAVGEGVLEGEPLLEEMSKHLHDVVMNGGMDGHNSGVATDPTKVEQVKDMLTNFVSKMRSWAYLTAKGDVGRVAKELSRGALYALVKPMQMGAKAMEKAIGNYGADWSNLIRGLAKPTEAEIQRLRATGGEAAVKQRMAEYESMDMLSLEELLNNFHALSKLADKVAELRPQLYDIVKHIPVPIPGARSFNEITTTFNRMYEAYYASNKHKLPYRDAHEAHEASTRDLRLWMFSARQFELVDRVKEDMAKYEADVAAWEKSTAAKKKKKPKKGEVLQELEQPEKPKKPKLPKITEEGTRWAESVKMLMEMRYGKNLAMFKATAQELTQWENHMVLDKLLNVGMITAKEHADMYSKGKHHIPMYRLRSMLDKSGAINTRLDDSMYKVLDYLKHDISMKMEDPINAMLRKAAGIEMLTMRQHAKNALGKRILADVRWWDIDYKDSPLSILSQKIAITKDEYDELSRTGQYKLTSAVKYKKDDQGNRIESGHTYYKHVPFTAEDVESGLKYATNPSVLKALKKTESQVRSEYEQRMFAFYPEPGKPMYVSIHDPHLAKAFFYMNNQQAVWANSVAGWVFSKIDSMAGAQEQAELQDKFLYHSTRLAATGYFGMNKISKSFITAAPAFIYNTLFRDLPGAKIRSRTGLRWIDIPGGFVQSAALMFPSMMEVFPEKFAVARDASQGMATFSGLSASNADGSLDADVLMSLTRGRGEKLAKAKSGHYGALASLMWGDMKQFFAKEGLTTAPGQMWSELKRGKNVGKHFMAMGLSPFTVARAAGQFAGSIIENATRLTERGLMMSEDMSQYPSLVAHYDPKKAINGKILAGTTGTIHRAKWEMAKAKLKMDPNYKVPEDAMPIQSNLTERDNAMSHVTVHFPQKGYWTASIDQLSMFYNPMAQDFYTNMMILTRHSALQKATAYALGENWEAAKDQVKLDSAAHAWIMKSLFYVTLPMMMMMASYGGDDDDSQDWQSQSFIEKSSYFWIPTNKMGLTERPLRVASGLGLFSLMFKDLPMAGMLEMQGKDPKAMHKWMRRFFDSTPFGAVGIPAMDYEQYGWKPATMSALTKSVPLLAPESVNPVFELMADRQQFRDKAIAFPQELSREDPTEVQREKYNMLTNAITKAFSSARMQPAQVQYLISRYFTGSNRWLPVVANKAMEMSAGAEGVPQDVQSSNSPLANQSAGWAPRVQARESYGVGNEFVQDLLSTAREASEQRKSYESMNTTRKPSYLAEHKLIQDDIYFGKRGQDGYRSGGLQAAAKKVIEWERSKKEALKAGRIDKVEALLIEKQYTLFAMEAMRNVMFQLGE